MKFSFQGMEVEAEFDLSIDLAVSYAGEWHSLNDRRNYVASADGFGKHEQTFRRKTVTSDYYAGSYTVRSVPDGVKRTWVVLVKGATQTELEQAQEDLIAWFTQDVFNLRVIKNEIIETISAERADYSVDASHVYAHNGMALLSFTFDCRPTVRREVLL